MSIDHKEAFTGRYLRYGDFTRIPSTQAGQPPYRVTLKQEQGPADWEPVLACECEGYRHRKACRHQRIAAIEVLLASPCPECGGRLNLAGQTMGGLDYIACCKCEFSVDFAK